MRIRVINTTLLVITLIGVVFAYRAGNKYRQLLAEYTQLEAELGQMPIADPSKICVLALETGEELHFAWRVYFPANSQPRWRHTYSWGSSTGWTLSSNDPMQCIVRVRIREDGHGALEMFTKKDAGGSRTVLAERELADLVRGHWNELPIEQLGANGMVMVNPIEIATLLRLTLPADLKQKGEESDNKFMRRWVQKDFLEICFGPNNAFQQEDTENEESDDP